MPNPDHIVHIGAGLCPELEDYRGLRAGQITLVEPNPEFVAALKALAGESERIAVLPTAVAERTGSATLHQFNFPGLDSLRRPAGLDQLLPGLRQIGRLPVPTISPEQLVHQLDLQRARNNWLILEAPGEEAAILGALGRGNMLQKFQRLIVRLGVEPFYEDGSWVEPMLKQLEEFGYMPETGPDTTDADWPRFHLKFQPQALVAVELQQELDARAAEMTKLNDKLAQRTVEINTLKKRLFEANQKSQEHKTRLEEAQTDLSLALRMQMLHENDLKELQARYGEVLTIKNEQQELLTQLHHRLSRAAEYLKLVNAHSEDQRLPEELLDALTGNGEASN